MNNGRFADAVASIADARNYMCAMIDGLAKQKRDSVVAGISPAEMASWPIKRQEAEQFTGADASAPLLSAEAQSRGIATAAMVQRVLANGAALSALEAVIAGNSGRHRDAVNALTDYDAIANYDYSAGWPV